MDSKFAITIAALYRFAAFPNPAALQPIVANICKSNSIRGTILLAYEGINGTIGGSVDDIDAVISYLRTLPGCSDLDVKYSHAKKMPFYRLKVRVKREIVTMGVAGINPNRQAGAYVQSKDWNALISDPNTILIDTRNDYEVAIGTFDGAINPRTKTFREFPDWFREHRDALMSDGKTPKFAMFCTGGIRCEKSTAFLKAEGIEDVYHLEGGILRYLETVPEEDSKWQGECFVFDDRVSVKHGLELGSMELCHACRRPITQKDKNAPLFVEGVSCAACHDEHSGEDRERFAQRQLQIKLARKRGEEHIGATSPKHA